MTYGIWCRVSGGITGMREAWLKQHGARAEYGTREEAEKEAKALSEVMNHNRRTADFSYRAMEIF